MSMLQLLGGVAAAGVVAAGSTALTGSGVVWGGSNGATASQFVGGTVQQTIAGASVTGVVYGFADTAKTQTNSIAITVDGAATKTLTITPGGGTFGGTPAVADEWTCTGGTVTPVRHATAPVVTIPAGSSTTITCVPADSTNSHATSGRYYTALSTLDLTIA